MRTGQERKFAVRSFISVVAGEFFVGFGGGGGGAVGVR